MNFHYRKNSFFFFCSVYIKMSGTVQWHRCWKLRTEFQLKLFTHILPPHALIQNEDETQSQPTCCEKGQRHQGQEWGCVSHNGETLSWPFPKIFNDNPFQRFPFTSQQIHRVSAPSRLPTLVREVGSTPAFPSRYPGRDRGTTLLAPGGWVIRSTWGKLVLPDFRGRHPKGLYHRSGAEQSFSRLQ